MEKHIARIVNKGLAGEPEHIVLQIKENLRFIEFSEIKYVEEPGQRREVSLMDNNLNQPEILHILNDMGHECLISVDENNFVIVYF